MLRSRICYILRMGLITVALLAAAVTGDSKEKLKLPSPRPIVTTGSYWRFHLTYGPICYLDRSGKLQVRGKSKRYAGFLVKSTFHNPTTEGPPANWATPDFDDSVWPVQRLPVDMPLLAGTARTPVPSAQFVRRMCVRTRFLVPDPARVKRLRLKIRYYGGVIVWVNGHEVGRGHIPSEGVLAEKHFAEPYPLKAYHPVDPKNAALGKKYKLMYGKWWAFGPKPGTDLSDGRKFKIIDKEGQELAREVDKLRRRIMEAEIPASLLKPGINILAIEKRSAPKNGAVLCRAYGLSHGSIDRVELQAVPESSVLSADSRPEGVHVWAEDIHRWVGPGDFLERGVKEKRAMKLACARNGVCSAQAVIGTTRELKNPSATIGTLTGPGGAVFPDTAVTVRWPRPVNVQKILEMDEIGRGGRGSLSLHTRRAKCAHGFRPRDILSVFGYSYSYGRPVEFFDPLTPKAPSTIPADTSRSFWLTVKVPADAVPGRYTGNVTVSANGMKPVTMNVRLYVFDWKLPDPREFVAYAGIDESPWSLAEWVKVKPWSSKHWKLVEEAMAWAGKLGARVAGVPVIHDSDMRNRKDPMVIWIKKGNDTYDYDFTLMDRYLKLWQKYSHKNSDVIVYLTLSTVKSGYYTCGGPPGMVTLRDPKTGEEKPFHPLKPGEKPSKKWLGRKLSEVKPFSKDSPGIKRWIQCARAVRVHLNELGFSDNRIHWGMYHDSIEPNSKVLAEALAEVVPTVGWARVSHYDNQKPLGESKAFESWRTAIRGTHNKAPFFMKYKMVEMLVKRKNGTMRKRPSRCYLLDTYKVESLKGWSDPKNVLALARDDSDNMSFSLYPPLWQLRETMELPITTVYRGFSRFSIDGWNRQGYYGPYISFLAYPDESGTRMEGSVQLEALREGLQEAEARVFLEKQGSLSTDARKVLNKRIERAWVAPCCSRGLAIMDFFYGWQELSWDLYAAAARAAGGKASGKADRDAFFK